MNTVSKGACEIERGTSLDLKSPNDNRGQHTFAYGFRLYQKEKQHFIVDITSLTAQKKCDKKLITVSDIISYEISDQQE